MDKTISLWVPGVRDMTQKDDRYKAMGLIQGLCDQNKMDVAVVVGDPISKARPRWVSGRGGRKPYTPQKTVDGEKKIAWALTGILKRKGNVAVSCIFHRSNHQRMDIDNMLKAVLDAGTRAGVWDDDSQVTALIGILEYDPEKPRTIICLGDHRSSLKRGENILPVCENCGKKFRAFGNRRVGSAKWCSIECRKKQGC